jgi:hypothetical protein
VRITSRRNGGGTVIQVDGHLRGQGIDELERVVADLGGPVRLDLAGLRSASESGLAALRSFRAKGLVLEGASPYIALLLDAPPEGARPTGQRPREKPPRAGV